MPVPDELVLMRTPHPAAVPAAHTNAHELNMRALLETIGLIAAPTTLVTALAFYIGAVRQEELAGHFGLQSSLLGLSTRDYVFRSTAVLVPFLVVLSLVTLVSVITGVALVMWSARRPQRVQQVIASITAGLGTLLTAMGVWRLVDPLSLGSRWYLVGPVALALGTGGLALGAWSLVKLDVFGLGGRARTLTRIGVAPLVVLALISVFWAANDYARVQGAARGTQLERTIQTQLPAVVVYSSTRLHLGGEGVAERVLETTADGSQRYRYEGLRLLLHSGGNYFLLPAGWSRHDGVTVMLPADAVRIEFRPRGAR